MIRILTISLLLIFSFNIIAKKRAVGKITYLEGSIFVQKQGDTKWKKAKYKSIVYANDAIKTELESRCEIYLINKRIIRLSESSEITLQEIKSGPIDININKGSVWANIKKLSTPRKFNVNTPTATAAIRGTVFSTSCNNTNSANYLVMNGEIAVSTGKDSKDKISVKSGEIITMVKDLDSYIESEQKAFENFAKKEQEEFNKFVKAENESFNKFKKEQATAFRRFTSANREDFKKIGDMNYAKRKANLRELKSTEWLKFNLKRDKKSAW